MIRMSSTRGVERRGSHAAARDDRVRDDLEDATRSPLEFGRQRVRACGTGLDTAWW